MEYNIFRMPREEELTPLKLQKFIGDNEFISNRLYRPLERAYRNDYDIYHQKPKPNNKPDNRLSVNFAKYIADTFNGFFVGIPIKVQCDDKRVKEFVDLFGAYNSIDDKNSEISKICSIYGRAYEFYYLDAEKNVCVQYALPTESFIIYDDSALTRPLYFCRYYYDSEKVMHGSLSDGSTVCYFTNKGELIFEDYEALHGFCDVPATEWVENEERIGIYSGALPLMNGYNKALSEKANDVDYFADAYMKITGRQLTPEQLEGIKDSRIINIYGTGGEQCDASFLARPSADETQENLLNRLERLIFVTSMVANINDENFDAAASGRAMQYRYSIMGNLFQTKQRKFEGALNRRYKLIFSNPVNSMAADDWMKLNFIFTPNYPVDYSEDAAVVEKLKGTVSDETLLSKLRIVDNVDEELERLAKQQDSTAYATDYPTNRVSGEGSDDEE